MNYLNNDDLVTNFIRLHISQEDAQEGFRIGGLPPKNIKPKVLINNTKFLLTMPINDKCEISVFHSFDFDGSNNPFSLSRTIYDHTKNSVLQFVPHQPQKRAQSSDLLSELTSHKIEISDTLYSEKEFDGEFCYPYHKIGGIPFFRFPLSESLIDTCDELMDAGYFHLLQLAFPMGPEDGDIEGNWPFGENVFHVFISNRDTDFKFKYIWG